MKTLATVIIVVLCIVAPASADVPYPVSYLEWWAPSKDQLYCSELCAFEAKRAHGSNTKWYGACLDYCKQAREDWREINRKDHH